jgi:hypothetical protein
MTAARISAKPVDGAAYSRRGVLRTTLAASVAAVAVVWLCAGMVAGHAGAPVAARSHTPSLFSLRAAVQGPLSAPLGADAPVYRVVSRAGTLRVVNPTQGLSAGFTGAGVSVEAGATRLGLSVRGLGYGGSLASLPAASPIAHGNRVVYARTGLSEWYANGPLGLEQGFTVARAPAHRAAGPLTIAMLLGGDARESLIGHGQLLLVGAGAGHVAALRYSGVRAVDARGHALKAWLALHGRRLLLQVDARGASYPVRIDPYFQQGEAFTAGEGAGFGAGVALSGDGSTAVVGDDTLVNHEAFIYARSGTAWNQQGEPLIGSGSGEHFGASVAMSSDGDTVLVGEPHTGAWVFVRSGETWTQQGPRLGSDGRSVALSSDGNTALVGAQVFVRSGEEWTEQQELVPNAEEPPGECCLEPAAFGGAVSLSADGSTALIGGRRTSGGAQAAWVFKRSGETWSQEGPLMYVPSGLEGGGGFGDSVALAPDGASALIGAPDGQRVFVFAPSGETWTKRASLGPGGGPGTLFGRGVAISGDGSTALIGGELGDVGQEEPVWFYTRSGEGWAQVGAARVGAGEISRSEFGSRVALSNDGGLALVGGPGAEHEAERGAVWTFVRESLTPPEIGRCTVSAKGAGEYASAACSALGGPSGHEWIPGAANGIGFTTKIAEGAALFETVHAGKVTCKGESGGGHYAGRNALSGATLAFTGCERLSQPCTSPGGASGEIATATLGGALGISQRKLTPKESKLGLDFSPSSEGTPFMQFTCGATPVVVRGSVILPVLANKMAVSQTVKFVATKGKQKPEGFVEAPKDVLEASFGGGAYEQIGLTLKVALTGEQSTEFNPAF